MDSQNKKKMIIAAVLVVIGFGALTLYMSRGPKPLTSPEGMKETVETTQEQPDAKTADGSESAGAKTSVARTSGKEKKTPVATTQNTPSIDTAVAAKSTSPSADAPANTDAPAKGTEVAAEEPSMLKRIFSFFGSKGEKTTAGSSVGVAVPEVAVPGAVAPGLATSGAPVSAAKVAEEPKPVGKQCFTSSYQHKHIRSHASGEACMHHRNVIKIAHNGVNAKTVCVRVNGTPVRFEQRKNKTNEFVIGPVAGPKAKITASYCVGKETCEEDCTVPRDEFMDAIGGSEEVGGLAVAQWDPSDTTGGDEDVSAKIEAEFKDEFRETAELGLFEGWINESQSQSCGNKQVAGL